jgi:1-acyl-sn-glycerol-3-phosphate acyltransferase
LSREGDPQPPPGTIEASLDGSVDELRQALDALRGEIRTRFPEPAAMVTPWQRVDWDGLLRTARRRVSTLGMTERSGEVDEFGMDEVVLRRARPLLDLLFDRYFRVELHGVENLPETGPCLLVANRSGLLPYDGLIVAHAIERTHPSGERPRFFVADWLMTLPFVQPYLARLGGVRACRENAERLIESRHFIVVFPEGAKGAAKVFRERYRLKRFGRGGVVRVALETGAPIIPVGIVGGEEAHPVLFKWGAPARFIGLPFLPVTPTFPLLGPLGFLPLPSKWVIRFGEKLATDHLPADAASDELLISRMTADMRNRVQTLVDTGLADRESIWG